MFTFKRENKKDAGCGGRGGGEGRGGNECL